jgi:hypothetical protein
MTFKRKLVGSSTNKVLSIFTLLVEATQIIFFSLKLSLIELFSDSCISTTYDILHTILYVCTNYFLALYNDFTLSIIAFCIRISQAWLV